MGTFINWARNQSITPAEIRTPTSAAEVAQAVRDAAKTGRRVRMVGSGHSFTDAALTDGIMLRPTALTGVLAEGDGWVKVAAGTPIHVINRELDRRGRAIANLGDITAQTISGALLTGTHGTGRTEGGFAEQVIELEMVLADGTITTVREGDLFDAARVSIGALGIVTAVTIRTVPAFLLRCHRAPMRLSTVLEHLDELTAGNDHLDFYWLPHTDTCLVKRYNRDPGPARPPSAFHRWFENEFLENTLFGAACALGARIPRAIPTINGISGRLLGTSEYVDASYKVFATVRRVRFLEMEYGIPREHLGTALRELRDLIDRSGWRISFPIEIRVTPPSTAWLSAAYGRPTAYIACHVYQPTPNPEYFAAAEEIMTRYQGRPHWGKLHTRDAAYLASVYPRFGDFRALRDRLDPERRFTNAYLDRVLGTA